jgi:hypothetical protein
LHFSIMMQFPQLPLEAGSPAGSVGSPSNFALPPPAGVGVADLLELGKTLRIFLSCVERYPEDAVVGAVAARALAPLAQAMELCVRGVLDEFRAASKGGNFAALLSSIWFVREFCEASGSARELVRQYGGLELLGPALLLPGGDQRLVHEAVRLLYCLQGCKGVLDAIPRLTQGGPLVVAQLLWQLREHGRHSWQEVTDLPPTEVVRAAMGSIQIFPGDWGVHEAALALLSDVLGTVEYRSAFAQCGGWPFILMVLESQQHNLEVQRRGLQILCELQRGGVWGVDYVQRSEQVVLLALQAFYKDKNILEWGLWLLLEFGGLHHVLPAVEAGPTSNAGLGSLRALRSVQWGQTEGTGSGVIPEVVRVLRSAMLHGLQRGSKEVVDLSMEMLLDVGCVAAAVPDDGLSVELVQAGAGVVKLLLETMRQKMGEATLVEQSLRVGRLFQAAPSGSSIQLQVRDGLLGGPAPALLQQLGDAHISHDGVQQQVLWVQGVLLGPAAVVRVMEGSSMPCVLAGVKTLGQLFDDMDDLDTTARQARLQVGEGDHGSYAGLASRRSPPYAFVLCLVGLGCAWRRRQRRLLPSASPQIWSACGMADCSFLG